MYPLLIHELFNFLLITLGILCAGMGLKGFLFSSNFIGCGVTGVSMLLAKTTSLQLSIWLPIVNLISKNNNFLKVGDVILGFNILIFVVTIAILGIE